MTNLRKAFLAISLTGAMYGCATDNTGTGDDDGSGSDDGSGMQMQSPVCGDHTCAAAESTASCPSDCPAATVCGDGTCSGDETVASCGFDCTPPPACGDGVCNGNETSASCAQDCPVGACSSSPDNCTGDNICVTGSCVPAFGRVYKLYMADGQMTQNDAMGATWDPSGGLPDPFVSIFLNGTWAADTAAKSDTLTPAWNSNTTITVAAGAKMQLDVFDDDLTVNDSMFSCFNLSLSADVLRKHSTAYANSCSGTGALSAAHVRFYFVPQ